MDGACTLAPLQEEAGGAHEVHRSLTTMTYNPSLKSTVPLLLPPLKNRPYTVSGSIDMTSAGTATSIANSKLAALKAIIELCDCARSALPSGVRITSVQQRFFTLYRIFGHLSLMRLSLILLPTRDSTPSLDQLYFVVSKAAVSGAPAHRNVVQLQGFLASLPLGILFDSISSSSFVSTKVVKQLSSLTVIPMSEPVHVAGGGILVSPGMLHQVDWTIDNRVFTSDLKPLKHYDFIIGLDWLECYSPMQVH